MHSGFQTAASVHEHGERPECGQGRLWEKSAIPTVEPVGPTPPATRPPPTANPMPTPRPTPQTAPAPTTSQQRDWCVMGTMGWMDGLKYESGTKDGKEKLRIYARRFPCVEINTSYHAIPSPADVHKWAEITPPGFKFHPKLFQTLCGLDTSVKNLPMSVRSLASMRVWSDKPSERIGPSQLPEDAMHALWVCFHEALLAPLRAAGRLGVVMMQAFVAPGEQGRRAIEVVRERLGDVPLAVELRDRSWLAVERREATLAWLRRLRIALIAVDELESETPSARRQGPSVEAPSTRPLPINLHVTHPDFSYVRVHRRQGTQRLLPPDQLAAWVDRLRSLAREGLRGPVHFLWGTAHENQPMGNAKALEKLLGCGPADWQRSLDAPKGSLFACLATPPAHAPSAPRGPTASEASPVGAAAASSSPRPIGPAAASSSPRPIGPAAASSSPLPIGPAAASSSPRPIGPAAANGSPAVTTCSAAVAATARGATLLAPRAVAPPAAAVRMAAANRPAPSRPAADGPATSMLAQLRASAAQPAATSATPAQRGTAAEEARQWEARARLYNGAATSSQPPKRVKHCNSDAKRAEPAAAGQRSMTSFFG